MRFTPLVGLSCVLFLVSTACSESHNNDNSKSNADDALYSACESDKDCLGTGLVCDERRGCVECLQQEDCPADEACRRGVCSGESSPKQSDASIESGDAASESKSSVLTSDEQLDAGQETPSNTSPTSKSNTSDQNNSSASADSGSSGSASLDGGSQQTEQTPGEPATSTGPGSDPTQDAGVPDPPPATSDACVIRLQAIYRDFTDSHSDFGHKSCGDVAQGAVETNLNAEGRPVMKEGTGAEDACMSTPDNFNQWYTDGDYNARVVKDLVLYDDGNGGFVNRYGPNGEYFTYVDRDTTYPGGITLEACETSCGNYVLANDFNGGCNDYCMNYDVAAQLDEQKVTDAQRLLNDAIRQYGPSAPQVDMAEAAVAAAEMELSTAQAEAMQCHTDCDTGVEQRTTRCADTCRPCSVGSGYCTFGEVVEVNGTPLFFPLDDVEGATLARAALPPVYGYRGWPYEDEVFPDAPEHNFYFTTEIQTTLELRSDRAAELQFLGDDDLWVFINGRLALDVGGLHPPAGGTVTIDAALGTVTSIVSDSDSNGTLTELSRDELTLSDFNLEPGGVYTVSVFQAEREEPGSSFRLQLTGFDDSLVECPNPTQ